MSFITLIEQKRPNKLTRYVPKHPTSWYSKAGTIKMLAAGIFGLLLVISLYQLSKTPLRELFRNKNNSEHPKTS